MCIAGYLYIRRPRDGTVFVPSGVFCLLRSLHSVRFGLLLRCSHKRIVNILKVYIERKNMQIELLRFRKQISQVFTFTFSNLHCKCVNCREHHILA